MPIPPRFPTLVYSASVSSAWTRPTVNTGTADEILNHRFSFYGETHSVPGLIDWDNLPGSRHWPHDMNRFSFLNTLLSAFEETGEKVYARKGLDLILGWIAQCLPLPPQESRVAWKSYLNIALHLETWLLFIAGVEQQSPDLVTDAEFDVIRESIRFQVDYLDEVIPRATNNWVIIGASGVLVSLAFLPDLPEGRAHSQRAWQRIDEALKRQILPDGVHDEMTPHYHFTVVVRTLRSLFFAEATPTPPPDSVYRSAGSMLHYMRQTLTPDGYQVAFNDSDPDYAKPVLQTLASPIARRLTDDSVPLSSECFPWSGIAIMREGPDRGRDECYLAFDCGPYGVSHQHEDKLGFWLSAFGRSFLVDPGRHLYDFSSVSLLPFLRSTAAHSTIMIDGHGQNALAAREIPGAWRPVEPQPLFWEKKQDGSCIAGGFYSLGYGPDQIAVTHFRILFFHADLQAWALVDSVEGEGEHLIESRFQFIPSTLSIRSNQIQTTFPDVNLALHIRNEDWRGGSRIVCGERHPDGGWFSPGLNRAEPAPCLVLSAGRVALPWKTTVALVPFRGTERRDPQISDECVARAEAAFSPILNRLRALREQCPGSCL